MKRIISLAMLTVFISGCSMFKTEVPATEQPSISWSEHFKKVNQLEKWRASGKVAISIDNKVQSAKLVWQQDADRFNIAFIGPLGQSGPVLRGDENSATLTIPKETPITGANTSSILQQRLGWQLPAESARYWIKGIPSPLSESKIILKNEKLVSLQQDGWDINYDKYRRNGDVELPVKITITRPKLKLKFAVYNWETQY